MKPTRSEAVRLKEEAASMTKDELRRLNKLYGWGEWLASAKKSVMVRGFVKRLDEIIAVTEDAADDYKAPGYHQIAVGMRFVEQRERPRTVIVTETSLYGVLVQVEDGHGRKKRPLQVFRKALIDSKRWRWLRS
jgi:hypothetical protein